MSGGVDSSVAALLLAKGVCAPKSTYIHIYIWVDFFQDYDLSAVYMRNWDTRDEFGTDHGCEWEKDWEDVRMVCRKIGIPCELVSVGDFT